MKCACGVTIGALPLCGVISSSMIAPGRPIASSTALAMAPTAVMPLSIAKFISSGGWKF
jgi:hypothetical protein